MPISLSLIFRPPSPCYRPKQTASLGYLPCHHHHDVKKLHTECLPSKASCTATINLYSILHLEEDLQPWTKALQAPPLQRQKNHQVKHTEHSRAPSHNTETHVHNTQSPKTT